MAVSAGARSAPVLPAVPAACLFIAPIGYAVYQSLLKVERTGPLGPRGRPDGLRRPGQLPLGPRRRPSPTASCGCCCFGVGPGAGDDRCSATVLALLLDTASARWVPFFRAAYFLPYGVPGVIASILWGFLYVPGRQPDRRRCSARSGCTSTSSARDTRAVVHRQHRHLGVRRLQHAGARRPAQGDPAGAVRGRAASTAPTPGRSAVHIKLPLIRPALVLTTVFTIIGTLQLFAEPLVLQAADHRDHRHLHPNLSAYNEAFTNNNSASPRPRR